MFGVLIGTLSLIGFVKVWKYGRFGHGYRHGGHRRWMLRRFFEQLDTTPGQEKVVLEVLDETERKAWATRDVFRNSRTSFAQAVRGEHFDGARVDETFAAQQTAIDEMKSTLRGGMAKIHEALNDAQRKALADLIEYGPRHMHGCGPSRRRGFGPMSRGSETVSV